jgi:hypothetical protein
MKSRSRHQSAKRSRWDHCNTPDALRRRRAKRDAKREALAATLPPIDPGPQPLDAWQTVQVIDASGRVALSVQLLVPTHGRCDQHAALIDGAQAGKLLTATEVGRMIAAAIVKRPNRSVLSELQGLAA